jgi:hypothetical protein
MDFSMQPPSAEEASRILRPVDYPERLVGLKMSAMGGSNPTELYSLEDAARFIHVDDYEIALKDNHATVGYVDPKALAAWVSEVLGDPTLSDAITSLAETDAFYGSIALDIKALLAARLEQCKEVLAPAEQAAS